jgi:hypothetical protein
VNIRTQKRGKDRMAGPTFGKHLIPSTNPNLFSDHL